MLLHFQRFRHVAADRRLALVVAKAAENVPPSLEPRWGEAGANEVGSLRLAVERSLPGHTIYVEPGRHHAANVTIRCVHCVHTVQLAADGGVT